MFFSGVVGGATGTVVLFTAGSISSASSGFYCYVSSGTWFIGINPSGATGVTGRKVSATAIVSTSADNHLALLLDFKNGEAKAWVDGVATYPANADRNNTFVDAALDNALADGTVGLTIFGRYDGTTTASRTTANLVNCHSGSIKNFFMANLNNVENPWRNAERIVQLLNKQRGVMRSLPNLITETW